MGGFLLCFAKVKSGTVEGGDIGEGTSFESIKKINRGGKERELEEMEQEEHYFV